MCVVCIYSTNNFTIERHFRIDISVSWYSWNNSDLILSNAAINNLHFWIKRIVNGFDAMEYEGICGWTLSMKKAINKSVVIFNSSFNYLWEYKNNFVPVQGRFLKFPNSRQFFGMNVASNIDMSWWLRIFFNCLYQFPTKKNPSTCASVVRVFGNDIAKRFSNPYFY